MSENISKNCCFFGHRDIKETEEIKNTLFDTIENLITEKEINTFFFGSKSQFNSLCLKVVSILRKKYPHIQRIYVRAEFPYINDDYKDYLLQYYEDTYFPQKLLGAGKSVYIERNYEMINNSAFCVVYYDKNYTPPQRKISRKDVIAHQPNSGTKLAYDYALKKHREIILINETLL